MLLVLILLLLTCVGAQGEDWPQFLGPARNGVYSGPELPVSWPKSGPPLLWKIDVGQGFSGPVVARGRVILFHRRENRAIVDSFDALTGKPVWSVDYPTDYRDDFGFDEGPRATPAIAGERIYTFGAEGVLQALDFSTYLMEWLVTTPRWRDYYLGHDQTGPYAYLKKVLKVLTHLKGPNRWAIKCPQHMEHLAVLYKTFPDATFVMTHRDPVACVQSAITQLCYNGRIFRKRIDADERAAYWIDRYKRLLQRYVDQRPGLPDAQTIDVYFHEWTKDQDTILKQIYAKADLPLTDEALAALHTWLAEHEHGYQGKVVYDLRRDFGLDPNEVRKEFQFYFDAYPVKPEVF